MPDLKEGDVLTLDVEFNGSAPGTPLIVTQVDDGDGVKAYHLEVKANGEIND